MRWLNRVTVLSAIGSCFAFGTACNPRGPGPVFGPGVGAEASSYTGIYEMDASGYSQDCGEQLESDLESKKERFFAVRMSEGRAPDKQLVPTLQIFSCVDAEDCRRKNAAANDDFSAEWAAIFDIGNGPTFESADPYPVEPTGGTCVDGEVSFESAVFEGAHFQYETRLVKAADYPPDGKDCFIPAAIDAAAGGKCTGRAVTSGNKIADL